MTTSANSMILKRKIRNSIRYYRLWRAYGYEGIQLEWKEKNKNHVHVINRNPPVIYMWWGRDDYVLHKALWNQPLIILYLFPWCTTLDDIPLIAKEVIERLKYFPSHRIVFLCNEEFTVEPLRKAGVEAIFCNQNAFLNENIFRPLQEVPKEFDAVYSAGLSPYKRHFLASQIKSLSILSYSYKGMHADSYEKEVRQALSHASWLKDSTEDKKKVTSEELSHLYNTSRVGLILSEREGAVFTSVEYLLCGIPVVSTQSIGGRDVFWDERFVIVCEATPESVKNAVDELKNRNIDPHMIRSETLSRMKKHREELRNFLLPVVNSFDCPWEPGTHGPFTFFDLGLLGKTIREGTNQRLP